MSDQQQRQPASDRTGDEWLAALRAEGVHASAAHTELRDYLRRGLGRIFGERGVDDATLEDLTQDAMIRITSRLDGFRGESRFTTWAMAIAIRVAHTALRRRRWGDRSLEDLGLDPDRPAAAAGAASHPADPAVRGDLLSALRAAIESDLTPRQRTAVLAELAGMMPLLAEQMGSNANALYKLHHDARQRLKSALAARGFDEADVRGILQGASNS